MLARSGMALGFAPSANAVLAAVRAEHVGQTSGVTNAIHEVGGVLGIALLASVFSGHGSYAGPHTFVTGIQPALIVGAAGLTPGALAAVAIAIAQEQLEDESGTQTRVIAPGR